MRLQLVNDRRSFEIEASLKITTNAPIITKDWTHSQKASLCCPMNGKNFKEIYWLFCETHNCLQFRTYFANNLPQILFVQGPLYPLGIVRFACSLHRGIGMYIEQMNKRTVLARGGSLSEKRFSTRHNTVYATLRTTTYFAHRVSVYIRNFPTE